MMRFKRTARKSTGARQNNPAKEKSPQWHIDLSKKDNWVFLMNNTQYDLKSMVNSLAELEKKFLELNDEKEKEIETLVKKLAKAEAKCAKQEEIIYDLLKSSKDTNIHKVSAEDDEEIITIDNEGEEEQDKKSSWGANKDSPDSP